MIFWRRKKVPIFDMVHNNFFLLFFSCCVFDETLAAFSGTTYHFCLDYHGPYEGLTTPVYRRQGTTKEGTTKGDCSWRRFQEAASFSTWHRYVSSGGGEWRHLPSLSCVEGDSSLSEVD